MLRPLGVEPLAPAIAGFVLGTAPDTVDWLSAMIGLSERWSVYGWFHGKKRWYVMILPPVWLHIGMDTIIHTTPGYNWWPEFWYLEVEMWLVSALVLWNVFLTTS
jgi:hypothetical protein